MFSKRWGLAVFAFFLPLTQWLPDIPLPGLNAINPDVAAADRARPHGRARAPASAGHGEPLLIPIAIIVIFTTIAWLRIYFLDVLPEVFLTGGGMWYDFVTWKEILLGFCFYYCSRRLTREPEARLASPRGHRRAATGSRPQPRRASSSSGSWRATGHMGQPNKLGDFLAGYVTIPAAFMFGGKYSVYAAAGVAVVGLLGLLGAVSRGAILATTLAHRPDGDAAAAACGSRSSPRRS